MFKKKLCSLGLAFFTLLPLANSKFNMCTATKDLVLGRVNVEKFCDDAFPNHLRERFLNLKNEAERLHNLFLNQGAVPPGLTEMIGIFNILSGYLKYLSNSRENSAKTTSMEKLDQNNLILFSITLLRIYEMKEIERRAYRNFGIPSPQSFDLRVNLFSGSIFSPVPLDVNSNSVDGIKRNLITMIDQSCIGEDKQIHDLSETLVDLFNHQLETTFWIFNEKLRTISLSSTNPNSTDINAE